jgi:hypothetical protein
MAYSYKLSECGNLYPQIYNCLCSLPDITLQHSDHELRHPLAIYNTSLRRVTQAFQEVLDENDKVYQAPYKEDGNCDIEVHALIKAQQELLDALMAHLDDGYNILKALYPASRFTKSIPFAAQWLERAKHPTVRQYKHQIKVYRDTFAPIVNKIKHEHGRLRIVLMHDGRNIYDQQRRIAGYFLEGVDKDGKIGADVKIHNGKYALSFHRNLRYHFVYLYLMGEFLTKAVVGAVNSEYNIGFAPMSSVAANSSEMEKIAKRINHLPLLFFFDELREPTPTVELIEQDQDVELVLTSMSPITANSYSPWRAQTQFTGDGVTSSWRMPYMGSY